MNNSKKTVTVVSIAVVFAIGLGIAIGMNLKKGSSEAGAPVADANLSGLSIDELAGKLSNFMLPEDEFSKLGSAIFQTAMGLFMQQAQQAGVEVNEAAQQDLKKSIDDKYSRKYFADMNANSMKELSKEDLIAINSFYNTDAGQKFLKLSPKIIQSTMQAVQADLTQWLPKTVDELVAKYKGGAPAGDKASAPEAGKDGLQEPPAKDEAKAPGENS